MNDSHNCSSSHQSNEDSQFNKSNNPEIFYEVFKSGEYIFFEGDLDSHFYIVQTGQVQIFTKNREGKRIDIIKIEPGESFGEFALLDNKPRSASAQAITDCSIIKVTEAGYQELLNDLPVWASSMLRSFAQRLSEMTHRLQEVPQFIKRELKSDPKSKSNLTDPL